MSDHMAYATGEFVAEHLEPTAEIDMEWPHDRIQPNGVDVGVDKVERISGDAVFMSKGYGYEKPDRTKLELRETNGEGDFWRLPPGSYALTYDVKFEIPDGYVGRMYPRSRVMRSGLHLTSALWDQGYEGIGEGLLQVPQSVDPVFIEKEARLAQFTLIESAAETENYDGTHQHENIEQSQQQSVSIDVQ